MEKNEREAGEETKGTKSAQSLAGDRYQALEYL